MAAAIVTEITGRDGSKDVDTNKRYRRTWLVRTTAPQDGASVVLAASPVAFNDAYSYVDDSTPGAPVTVTDAAAVCVDISVSQDNTNDPQDWRIVAQYAGVDDPVGQPAEVEYSPTRYQKALVVDVKGKPVVNSAFDPFESGITVDRTRFTLTLSKNVLTWDPVAMLPYQDSLNQSIFLAAVHPPGFAAGTCKLNISAKRMRRKGTNSFYWHRTAIIDIDIEGWQIKVRDAGFNELVRDPDTGEIKGDRKIMVGGPVGSSMRTGDYATSPQLLKLNGSALPRGATVPLPLPFDGYETKNWAPLGLEYTATN